LGQLIEADKTGEHTHQISKRVNGMTPQQQNIKMLQESGLTRREIAAQLGLSFHTVKSHLYGATRRNTKTAKPPVRYDRKLANGFDEASEELLEILPSQQKETCRLAFQGHGEEATRERLGISASTVKSHRENILRRLREHIQEAHGVQIPELRHETPGLSPAEYLHLHAVLSGRHDYLNHLFGISRLTTSERAVITLAAIGLTQEQIATLRFVTKKTVRTLRENAYRKIEEKADIGSIISANTPEFICQAINSLNEKEARG
jgi:DNA-binding NarL/FixJ family response regulator